MASLIFMLMMQYVVSTKAGMVNHIQGDVSLKASDSAVAGAPITTGPSGYAEILLNPGSFLRLGENSEVVIDNVELENIVVRTISGAAVIEVTEIDDDFPITVTSGDLTVEIVQPGLYKFEDARAAVLDGKLRTKDSRIAYKKGWVVLNPPGGIRAVKLGKNESPTGLETWSKNRSTLIANANIESFQSFRHERPGRSESSWLWVPGFGVWTFMPASRIRSPYGHRYRSYIEIFSNERNAFSANSGSYSRERTVTPQSSPSPSVLPGNSSVGGASPSGEYIGRKDPPVPATIP